MKHMSHCEQIHGYCTAVFLLFWRHTSAFKKQYILSILELIITSNKKFRYQPNKVLLNKTYVKQQHIIRY